MVYYSYKASRLKLEQTLKARPKERKKRIEYEQRMALARYFAEQKKIVKNLENWMMRRDRSQVLPPKMVHELLTPEECNELIQFLKNTHI